MKDIYGIFYKCDDKSILHSTYINQQLAETQLKFLQAENRNKQMCVEKIFLHEDEKEIIAPKTYVIYGNIDKELNIMLYESNPNIEIPIPNKLYDVNYFLVQYKRQSYDFTMLIPGRYMNNFDDIKQKLIQDFLKFKEQLSALLGMTTVEFISNFESMNSLSINLFRIDYEQEIYMEDCQNNVIITYNNLCNGFIKFFQKEFGGLFNKFIGMDSYVLEQSEQEFLTTICSYEWFDDKNPYNLKSYFMDYIINTYNYYTFIKEGKFQCNWKIVNNRVYITKSC